GAASVTTIAEWIRERAGDDRPALLFEDRSWSYRQLAEEAAARAALLRALPAREPAHVGVLLENVPEFVFWLAAAALGRRVVVGINPTRRGAELERDVRATDCGWIVTDSGNLGLLEGLDTGVGAERTFAVDDERYTALVAAHRGSPLPDAKADPGDLFVL